MKFFFKGLVYLKDIVAERSAIHWFTPQMPVSARAGPGQIHEPRMPSKSLLQVVGAQVLGPSSTAFPGILAGS